MNIGQYTFTEEPCELGPCWHVRGPGIHSVVDARDEALWAVGLCDAAYAAGQRAADKELVAVLAEELLAWRACNTAFMVRSESEADDVLAVQAEEWSHEVDRRLAEMNTTLADIAREAQ